MEKKVSIKDIAKLLGISISTVSFVVNGKAKEKRISEPLTKKVLELVEELGYKPDALAKSFRTGKTNIIGFLVDDISEPFFSGIARFIDEKASQNGYKIIYSSTRNNKTKAQELLQIFQDRHVDGYIIALPNGLEDEVKSLTMSRKPVVLFDRYFPDIKADFVIINNHQGTFNAVKHLKDKGYRNIGFITIDTIEQQMLDRLSGYEDAVKSEGLKSCVKKLTYGSSSELIHDVADFLKEEKGLDAIICATNYITMAGLRAIQQLGLKIPDDIALLSFDDFELLEFSAPPITAVAQPLEEIAENIMKILLKRLGSSKSDEEQQIEVVLPTVLNVRSSTVVKL
ncbi:LacI family DNA-binding transcriptional regulator [Pedobacter sp. B4-66]|uniref:LacI family DNA-binding transcriptional regulator n=1 Tax=Pedobacter sp. B4-66 TaxID=2817280 RepID=UPI001BDAACA5|nr:LacI family DNA-binding transcriptional regulator [Pedobacter sp. B4-66]